ncbi:MAG: hypothetical protein K0Q79_3166 [Flavipsychrobacter sp.]|jgi:hypothetical protein|nr:hypothetical protein [Flavipsychrobacter sp.]
MADDRSSQVPKDSFARMRQIDINKPETVPSFEQKTKDEIKMLKERVATLEKAMKQLKAKK